MMRPPPKSPLFPTTPLSGSAAHGGRPPHGLTLPSEQPARMPCRSGGAVEKSDRHSTKRDVRDQRARARPPRPPGPPRRSEEHTSELQSRQYLVCRLLLEKKK